jgi:hypothetical protein
MIGIVDYSSHIHSVVIYFLVKLRIIGIDKNGNGQLTKRRDG